MSLPQFDPWSKISSPGGRAYRAYCAYLDGKLGTLGTISTGAGTFFIENEDDDVRSWLPKLKSVDHETSAASDELRTAAIRFCRGPWPARLLALGWQAPEIFAVGTDSAGPGGLIKQLGNGDIRIATSAAAYFHDGTRLCSYVRTRLDLKYLPMIWDLD